MAIIPIKDLGRSLEVGDRVVVRTDLQIGTHAYAMLSDTKFQLFALGNMDNLRGKTVRITSIPHGRIKSYSIEGSSWRWTDEMFEGIWAPNDYGELNSDASPSLEFLFGGV